MNIQVLNMSLLSRSDWIESENVPVSCAQLCNVRDCQSRQTEILRHIGVVGAQEIPLVLGSLKIKPTKTLSEAA